MKTSPVWIRSEEDNPRFSEPGMPDKKMRLSLPGKRIGDSLQGNERLEKKHYFSLMSKKTPFQTAHLLKNYLRSCLYAFLPARE